MKTNVKKMTGFYRQLGNALLLSVISVQVAAQNEYSLPSVGAADNVDASTDPIDFIVSIFKVVGAAVLWIAVAWFGLMMFGAVIKAANEARGGESSWMEAGKSMLGNVVIFIVFLGIAIWYSAAFLA